MYIERENTSWALAIVLTMIVIALIMGYFFWFIPSVELEKTAATKPGIQKIDRGHAGASEPEQPSPVVGNLKTHFF